MQPEAPEDSLVENEGVNAGSAQQGEPDPGPSADVRSGGRPDDFDPEVVEYGDESLQAGELAGAPGRADADPALNDSGQDSGLMDGE